MSDQQTDNFITAARERIAFLERHCHDLLAQREKAIDEAIEAREQRDKVQARVAEMLGVLKDAREELRLLRMKDTSVVYDPSLRVRMDVAIFKAEAL